MARRAIGLLVAVAAIAVLAGPAAASGTVHLDGAFFTTFLKPNGVGWPVCPPGVDGDQCGVMQLAGLGAADFVYKFGPTFEPTGNKDCDAIDGTFTLILHADGSTVAGALSGVFCGPGNFGTTGRVHESGQAWGNPLSENDRIAFAGGSGRFVGLHGTASYQQSSAGAVYRGTLIGTLAVA